MKVPLPNIVYQRRSNPPFENFIFYIREMPRRVRPYQPKTHKLYLLGVWDSNNNSEGNLPPEFAFSSKDQVAMFEFVFKNIVKPSERRRFVGEIKEVIDNAGVQDRLHFEG